MEYNAGKYIEITVKEVELNEKRCDYTVYSYGDTKIPFSETFVFLLPRLHDVLFNELILLFYSVKQHKKQLRGVAKLKLKHIASSSASQNDDGVFLICPPSYLHKSDFYDEDFAPAGRAIISCRIISDRMDIPQSPAEHPGGLLNLLFVEEHAEMLKVAYEIFLATQRGSFACKLNWILGLISADYYYTYIYGECKKEECASEGERCPLPFCRSTYFPIEKEVAQENLRILQYAVASFAGALVTWGLPKRREMKGEKDPRKRAILEHLDVPAEDLLKDVHSDGHIPSHIVFISDDTLVVSFKGTTSIVEAMHDLNCDYTEFGEGYVHRGFKVLSERWINGCWKSLVQDAQQRGIKKILLTGQSLGAAVSIMIFLILHAQGLDDAFAISVVGFGPPPIVSRSIAQQDFPQIKIFAYGSDLVTRLSFGSVLDLKYVCISVSSLYNFLVRKSVVVEKIAEIKACLTNEDLYPKLYHPGRLFHIREFSTDGKPVALYKEVNYTFFGEIICSKRAPFDHLIHPIRAAFAHYAGHGEG